MSDGYEVNTAALRDIANGAQAEADTLRSRRIDPPTPDAGRSSGEIAAALAHLVNASTDLRNLCEYISTNFTEIADSYEQADAASCAEFDRIARRGPLG